MFLADLKALGMVMPCLSYLNALRQPPYGTRNQPRAAGHVLGPIVGGTDIFDQRKVVLAEIVRQFLGGEAERPLLFIVPEVPEDVPSARELFGVIENLFVEIGKDDIDTRKLFGPSKCRIDGARIQIVCDALPDNRRGRAEIDIALNPYLLQ